MTKEIKLTQERVAIVDDDMFDYLNQWKWHAHKSRDVFYAQRNEGKRSFRKKVHMHRVITNAPDNMEVDHWNGDGLDNRQENLRVCTQSENQRNRGKQANNKSGFKGVSWSKINKKWRADIMIDKKSVFFEYFETEIEAARAYDNAAMKYHGKFARLNFPDN